MDQHTTGLACLEDIKPIYLLPDDPFVSQVLIPCFQSSCAVDCMVGFFTSGVLVSLAPGLATFINESQGVFRLVISPIVRAEDWAAIETGVSGADEITVSILMTFSSPRTHSSTIPWSVCRGCSDRSDWKSKSH